MFVRPRSAEKNWPFLNYSSVPANSSLKSRLGVKKINTPNVSGISTKPPELEDIANSASVGHVENSSMTNPSYICDQEQDLNVCRYAR